MSRRSYTVLVCVQLISSAQGCAVPSAPVHGEVMVGPPCELAAATDLVSCDKSATNLALTQPVSASGDFGDTATVTDGDPSTGLPLSLGSTRPHVTVDLQHVKLLSAVTIWHGCSLGSSSSSSGPSTSGEELCQWENDGSCDVRGRCTTICCPCCTSSSPLTV